MATSAHKTRLIVGKVNVSCLATSVEASTSNTIHERTPFCETSHTSIKGRKSNAFTVGAMFDDATSSGSYWAEMVANDTNGTLLPVTVAPSGLAAASPVWLAEAHQMAYRPNGNADGAVDLGLEFNVTGLASFGQSITDLAAVTATANSAAVDGGAASSNGGVAHLHVTALDTPTTLDVDIEHSVDGSTSWATLASFTQVTTATATERVVVAAGTTVRRYLRAAFTVSGTSYTCAVAFARS